MPALEWPNESAAKQRASAPSSNEPNKFSVLSYAKHWERFHVRDCFTLHMEKRAFR